MEKFGIFELLDALAALTSSETVPEEKTLSTKDSVCRPPVYGDAGSPETKAEKTEPPSTAEKDALAGFYARHDAVAKKAKGPQTH